MVGQAVDAGRTCDPHRRLEDFPPQPGSSGQLGRAAGHDQTGGQHALVAGALDLLADLLEDLAHTRLDDLGQLASRGGRGVALADALDVDLLVLNDQGRICGSVLDLQLFSGGQARLEADGDVVGDVVSAER